MLNSTIENCKRLLEQSDYITILTGAGVSTNSNIADFQTTDKHWSHTLTRAEMTSYSNFKKHPESFWEYYWPLHEATQKAQPNQFHEFAQRLASNGRTVKVITQNIDGLHGEDFMVLDHKVLNEEGETGEKVPPLSLKVVNSYGDYEVIELHGTNKTAICVNDNCSNETLFSIEEVLNSPKCSTCGNLAKPNVVLFEEEVNNYEKANKAVKNCDLLIVAGASLKVFPVNQLPFSLNGGAGRTLNSFDDTAQTEYFFKNLPQKSLWVNKDQRPEDYDFFTESYLGDTSEFAQLFLEKL